MLTLIFDTETTGKADFAAPYNAAHQPRVVQLGALLVDDEGAEAAPALNVIVKPDGFEIPAEASAIHGITTERAMAEGIHIDDVLGMFLELLARAVSVAGHNISFDLLMMRRELSLAGVEERIKHPSFCTMQVMTPICRLPGRYGYKWPKLQEAYKHAFGREFEDAHDAMADVRATRDLFVWLKKREKEDQLPA